MRGRHYVKVDVSDGRAVGLLRQIDTAVPPTSGELWGNDGWEPTSLLVSVLALGDPSYDEITERQARGLFPGAFVQDST